MKVDYRYYATVVRVVDGDTIDLDVDLGFHTFTRIRTRLLGVDTPEKYGSRSCEAGYEASAFTEKLLPVGTQLRLESYKTGKYGRWLARIFLPNGSCLNDILRERYPLKGD